MMDKLALEMETFEEIIERFEVDVAQAKQCGDFAQMVSERASTLGSFMRALSLTSAVIASSKHMRARFEERDRCLVFLSSNSLLTFERMVALLTGREHGLREQHKRRYF